VAGEIAAVGDGGLGWAAGQRVVVDPGINRGAGRVHAPAEVGVGQPRLPHSREHVRGGAAEYVAVPAETWRRCHDGLDFPQAAAPLLAGLTGLAHAWIHRAGLQAASPFSSSAPAAAVNTLSIQIAKLAGAVVFAVASSEEKAARARSLGADVVIDRSQVTGCGRCSS